MSKFCGKIGYAFTKEAEPGVWEEVIEEHDTTGDMLKNTARVNINNSINDKVTSNNVVSLIADPYMLQNQNHIKFIRLMGIAWLVTSVEVQYPRLILNLGGIYNEQ